MTSPRGDGGVAAPRSNYGGNNEEADDSGLGWQLGRTGGGKTVNGARDGGGGLLCDVIVQSDLARDSGKTANYSAVVCDTGEMVATVVDKETDDKFDSGRESDETFDSESVKSDSAAPGDSQKRQPVDDGTVTRVRPSDKTRVTFWTDTYL